MDNLSAIESIFLAALDKPSAQQRAAYLDDVCGPDEDLRRRIERLLNAHSQAGSFLQSLAPDLTAAFAEQPIAERPGTTIGPYKLMEQFGEGGMGLVFVAEQQQPVRRRVALKVVKPGMDSREVIARFEAERQALALMDHPNIAKVLDAGTTATGRPYFVMELVKGVPITEYCDHQQLTPRQRLELFVPICHAVQHAHQKGIIHRDLKPSNVLVSSHDGTPIVKVIDFGIAKAIGQQLSDKTVYTRFAQMIGTPLYMSPEQAGMSDLDVDTRSDVYSLGVLLYELLTGTTPFDAKRLKEAAFDEIRRIIREEEPPKPSTRLSALGATLSSISAKRKTEPRKLPGLVRGDLDWIVMKALEKDRTRRYETASSFAADVRRFLTEEPIEARPPSALYRFGKFARRHRTAVFITSFVAVTLLALLVNETLGYFQIKAARDDAEAEAARATTAEGLAKDQRRAAVDAAAQEEKQRIRAENAKEKLRDALYDVEMSLMQPAWDADNLARFDQLLSRQRPALGDSDLRTFEWHYWNRLRHGGPPGVKLVAEARLGETLASNPVLSPDGTHVAAVVVANGRGALRVWDTTTGKVVRTLLDKLDYSKPLLAALMRIAFSANSPRVAVSTLVFKNVDEIKLLYGTATDNDLKDTRLQVRVWDVAVGKQLLDVTDATFPDPYGGLALSPNGQQLAFSTQLPAEQKQSTRIHLWDVDRNKELSSHAESTTPTALAFSPDGARLAGAMANVRRLGALFGIRNVDLGNKIQIWEVNPWKDVLTIQHPGNLAPFGVAFSPDQEVAWAHRLAVIWNDGMDRKTLSVYALTGMPQGKELLTIGEGITGTQPVFDSSGSRFSCDAAGSVVRIWDTAKGTVRFTVRGHEKTPAVAFARGRLWTAGLDGTVKEWGEVPPSPGPDGIEDSGNFYPLAVALGTERTRLAGAFRFDVKSAGELSFTIRVWDAEHGKYRVPIEVKAVPLAVRVQDLLLSADGRRLAATYLCMEPKTSRLKVWDTDSGEELFSPPESPSFPTGLAFSADGTRVAWAKDGRVTAWDVATKSKRLDVEDSWKLLWFFLTFSPDGKRLAWASDRRVCIWDVDPARESLVVSDPGGYVGSLAFSPDGQRLAACVGVGPMSFTEVKVWDAATGRELLSLKGETGLRDIAFSPDGRRLATLRQNPKEFDGQEVKMWDAHTGLLLLRLPAHAVGRETRQLQFTADGTRLLLLRTYPSQPGADGWRQLWDATPWPDNATQ